MTLANSSKYEDRYQQLLEKLYKLSKSVYERAPLKEGDNDCRFIIEHLAGLTIYSILGEVQGDIQQKDKNGDDLYTKNLLDKTKSICKKEIGNQAAQLWDNLMSDLKAHNHNSHGNVGFNQEREQEAYNNLKSAFQTFKRYLENAQNMPFNEDLKQKYEEIRWHIALIEKIICKPDLDPAIKKRMSSIVKTVVNDNVLPNHNEYYYGLILPQNVPVTLLDALIPLMGFKWNFIFYYVSENDAVFSTWSRIETTQLNVVSIKTRLSSTLSNWFFMKGPKGNWTKNELRNLINSLSSHPLQQKGIILFDLETDKKKSFMAMESLWRMFPISETNTPSYNTSIICVPSVETVKTKLEDEDYPVRTILEIPFNPAVFLEAVRDFLPYTFQVRETPLPPNLIDRCLDAGIKFIDSDDGYLQKTLWDNFYAGRQITYFELDLQHDVYPRGFEIFYMQFYKELRDRIKDLSTKEFNIVQQPGAGGTTVARRLAFDLMRDNQSKVMAVWITKWIPNKTEEQLRRLTENVKTVERWLIISDDKEIDVNDYPKLMRSIRNNNISAISLYLSHRLDVISTKRNPWTLILTSRLSGEKERKKFDDKFSKAFASSLQPLQISKLLKELRHSAPNNDDIEMIHYPYAFTEQTDKYHTLKSAKLDSFVQKWFHSISEESVKNVCGYVAFVYQHTASKALDIYSLRSLWDNGKGSTLKINITPPDYEAVDHLLKITPEEGSTVENSSLYSPRYAAFAEQILNNWKATWKSNLSAIAIELIKAFPKTDLFVEIVLRDLFITQSKQLRGSSKEGFVDKFSYLIGEILNSEESLYGARKVFDELITKYPDRPVYKIHLGRLLFEYANYKDLSSSDSLFAEAIELISDALDGETDDDTFYHVAGMYWSRFARAIHRDFYGTKEDIEELEAKLMDIIDRALDCFKQCNDINRGTSEYGFLSGAQLIVWFLPEIAKIRGVTTVDLISEEGYIKYMNILDSFVYELEKDTLYSNDSVKESLSKLRIKYYKIIGDLSSAIEDVRGNFEKSIGNNKVYYGHQEVSILTYSNDIKLNTPLKQRYFSLDRLEIERIVHILKILRDQTGDLKAAEKLFTLQRLINRDPLANSDTTNSLYAWYELAKKYNDSASILQASYYLYIMFALMLLNSSSNNADLKKRYLQYRNECEELGRLLEKNTGYSLKYLGCYYKGRWDSLLEPYEAVVKDRGQIKEYSLECKRVEADIVDVRGRHGVCEIGFLMNISFGSHKVDSYDIGNKKLVNGVLGFRYSGPGLYAFDVKSIGVVPLLMGEKENVESLEKNIIEEGKETVQGIEMESKNVLTDSHYEKNPRVKMGKLGGPGKKQTLVINKRQKKSKNLSMRVSSSSKILKGNR